LVACDRKYTMRLPVDREREREDDPCSPQSVPLSLMRLAYFDCFSGISGDMALGALVHAGADLATITETIGALPIEEFSLETEEVDLRGISALRIHVRSGPQSVIRTYAGLRALLDSADLPTEVLRTAQRIYRRLAEAAATVHGKDPELVTFHEYGDLDCLVEFVGCALALHLLEVERVFASAVPTGMGMTRTEHGIMPIPSPVVMELLQGVPTYSRGIPAELVTATGAAILAAISEGYGDMPLMRADHVGYGAGHLRLDFPNAMRVVVGEEQRAGIGARQSVGLGDMLDAADVLIESSTGRLDPAERDRLMQELLQAGATGTWVTSVIGPGGQAQLIVSALAPAERRDRIVDVFQGRDDFGDVRMLPTVRRSR
jgi:uncharacterized protein (TIGR00299 family) protein